MDLMDHLERLDRFLAGEEKGDVPIEILRARGVEIPPAASLNDTQLHATLWEILEKMADIGMVIDSTDHLSDRELYRYLVEDALLEEEILPEGVPGFCHLSPIGGWSEEDTRVYLRYYADDEERQDWRLRFDEPPPPKERLPYDRDRFLPGHV